MLKPRGSICNLGCAYCYYLSKERLYPGSGFCMPDEVLEAFTRQYIAAQRVLEVTFDWQGGEPLLMGLDFFRRAMALQEAYRKPGVRIVNALQTNGTLLDDDWCRFFREHGFLVGLSLDGPREAHDAYRVDKGGQPTFDRAMAGLALLQEHAVEFNILATVHAANAGRPLEVYRFLRDEVGARFLQFIPIVQREGGRVTDLSTTGRQYGQFLIAVFDEWGRRDVGRVLSSRTIGWATFWRRRWSNWWDRSRSGGLGWINGTRCPRPARLARCALCATAAVPRTASRV